LPAAKVGRLAFMLSCPQSIGGLALLLTRALSFFHGGIHPRLQVAHTRRDGTWRGHRKRFKESGSVKKRGRGPVHRLYDGCRCQLVGYGASRPLRPATARVALENRQQSRSEMGIIFNIGV